MARPFKKLGVTGEIRKNWLKRQDEYGESFSQIASKDGYDARTVRRQIEIARQEIELRETRLSVLRNAVEGHYLDLCRFAERLNLAVSHFESAEHLTSERLYAALRQHLPRSPLFALIDKWNRLQRELKNAKGDIETNIKNRVANDENLYKAFAGGEKDVPGIVELFKRQWELWVKSSGLDIDQVFNTAEPGEGGQARKVKATGSAFPHTPGYLFSQILGVELVDALNNGLH